MFNIVYAKTCVQWHQHCHTKIKYATIKQLETNYWGQMKHILTMKSSKRTKLLHFQNFISRTFLDNLSLEKKSRRQFTFLCTPARDLPWANFQTIFKAFPLLVRLQASKTEENMSRRSCLNLFQVLRRVVWQCTIQTSVFEVRGLVCHGWCHEFAEGNITSYWSCVHSKRFFLHKVCETQKTCMEFIRFQ